MIRPPLIKLMIRAANNLDVRNITCKWIKSMLEERLIQISSAGVGRQGCPYSGVLSPLLWDLVINELLTLMEIRETRIVAGMPK